MEPNVEPKSDILRIDLTGMNIRQWTTDVRSQFLIRIREAVATVLNDVDQTGELPTNRPEDIGAEALAAIETPSQDLEVTKSETFNEVEREYGKREEQRDIKQADAQLRLMNAEAERQELENLRTIVKLLRELEALISSTPSIAVCGTHGDDIIICPPSVIGELKKRVLTSSAATPEKIFGPATVADDVETSESSGQIPRGIMTGDASKRVTAMTLSGGGIRAALFHVGVLNCLHLAGQLANVRLIVSVSGGSITAAHFVSRWEQANRSDEDFVSVAANLLQFTRTNIRDSVFIPWIWSRLRIHRFLDWRLGRAARLEQIYSTHFGKITMGELASDPHSPRLAIAATDAIRHERVAFTSDNLLRYNFDGTFVFPAILSEGVPLSLAVAASSCFPPVFPRFRLSYKELGLKYHEFKDQLYLNDGGVSGNLGVELLCAISTPESSSNGIVLVADAERVKASKPGKSPGSDLDAQGSALSESARRLLSDSFGNRSVSVRFSDRVEGKSGLSFKTETVLAAYRTDLDAPSWHEIEALLLHGASVCSQALRNGEGSHAVSDEEIASTTARIMLAIGKPPNLAAPDPSMLSDCGRRPLGRLKLHGVLVAIVVLIGIVSTVFGAYYFFMW